jgi:PST family polysaccharide transporter
MSSIFWFNLFLTLLLTVFSVFLSPLVAAFYRQPVIKPVLWVLCLSFAVGGISALHAAILNREMRFGAILFSQAAGLISAFVVALLIAIYAHNVWALVAMTTVQSCVSSLLTVLQARWYPLFAIDFVRHFSLVKFGLNVLLYNSLNFVTNNISSVLIGYLYGPYPLGLFNRAYQIYQLPSTAVIQPVLQVMFPLFCRLSQHENELATSYLGLIARIGLLWIPTAAMLPLVSNDVVLIILGGRWVAAAPILAWLAPALAGLSMVAPFGQLMISQGRIRELRFWGLIEVLIRGGGAAVGSHFGPVGAAMGFSCTTLGVAVPAIIWIIARKSKITIADQYRAVLPAWFAAISTASGVFLGQLIAKDLALNLIGKVSLELLIAIVMWCATILLIPASRKIVADFILEIRPLSAILSRKTMPK